MISIIIPIYNVAPYLERCFDSILNQTYQDFEVILVDDGSTDNSRDVCQKYVERDQRFTYHYKKNGGVSSARNLGLQMVKGEFVYMLDPDDTIEENCLEWHFEKMTDDVDLVISGFRKVNESNVELFDTAQNVKIQGLLNISQTVLLYTKGVGVTYTWVCLFRLSVLQENHLSFDETLSVCEDIWFCFQYISCCRNIFYANVPLYNYYQRPGSLMNVSDTNLKAQNMLSEVRGRSMCCKLLENRVSFQVKIAVKMSFFYFVKYVQNFMKTIKLSEDNQHIIDGVASIYSSTLPFRDRILFHIYDGLKKCIRFGCKRIK